MDAADLDVRAASRICCAAAMQSSLTSPARPNTRRSERLSIFLIRRPSSGVHHALSAHQLRPELPKLPSVGSLSTTVLDLRRGFCRQVLNTIEPYADVQRLYSPSFSILLDSLNVERTIYKFAGFVGPVSDNVRELQGFTRTFDVYKCWFSV